MASAFPCVLTSRVDLGFAAFVWSQRELEGRFDVWLCKTALYTLQFLWKPATVAVAAVQLCSIGSNGSTGGRTRSRRLAVLPSTEPLLVVWMMQRKGGSKFYRLFSLLSAWRCSWRKAAARVPGAQLACLPFKRMRSSQYVHGEGHNPDVFVTWLSVGLSWVLCLITLFWDTPRGVVVRTAVVLPGRLSTGLHGHSRVPLRAGGCAASSAAACLWLSFCLCRQEKSCWQPRNVLWGVCIKAVKEFPAPACQLDGLHLLLVVHKSCAVCSVWRCALSVAVALLLADLGAQSLRLPACISLQTWAQMGWVQTIPAAVHIILYCKNWTCSVKPYVGMWEDLVSLGVCMEGADRLLQALPDVK